MMEPSESSSRRDKRLEEIKKQQRIMIAVLGTIAVMLIVYWSGILNPIGFGIKEASVDTGGGIDDLANAVTGEEYEFKYMDPWKKVDKLELDSLGEGFADGIKRSDPNAFVGIRVKKTNQKLGNLNDLIDSMDKVMPTKLKSFKKTGSEVINIGGREALKYSYTFDVGGGGKVAQSQFILSKDGDIYYLVLSSTTDDIDRATPEAEKIISSFKIK